MLDEDCSERLCHGQEGATTEEEARECPACGGRLGLKLTKVMGGFIGCSAYPQCSYAQPLERIMPGADQQLRVKSRPEGRLPTQATYHGSSYERLPHLPASFPTVSCGSPHAGQEAARHAGAPWKM